MILVPYVIISQARGSVTSVDNFSVYRYIIPGNFIELHLVVCQTAIKVKLSSIG